MGTKGKVKVLSPNVGVVPRNRLVPQTSREKSFFLILSSLRDNRLSMDVLRFTFVSGEGAPYAMRFFSPAFLIGTAPGCPSDNPEKFLPLDYPTRPETGREEHGWCVAG